MVLKTTMTKATLLSSAIALAVLAACGPAPVTPGQPTSGKLNAVSVSELSKGGTDSKTSIYLSWEGVTSAATTLKFFRREADQSAEQVSNITTLDNKGQTTFTDEDPSLTSGKTYVYNLRGDNQNAIAVVSAESKSVEVISASDIKGIQLIKPATNDSILKDPLGQGVEFEWEDAGTNLYHVQVSDLSGTVLWGAITKNTKITYGTRSGSEKIGSVNSASDPKLLVPLALTKRLSITSTAPNASRNELTYKGIGTNTQYRIQVNAIRTMPNIGDLANARAIAIRPAEEIRFIAQ
jgi:hypothetical protein